MRVSGMHGGVGVAEDTAHPFYSIANSLARRCDEVLGRLYRPHSRPPRRAYRGLRTGNRLKLGGGGDLARARTQEA